MNMRHILPFIAAAAAIMPVAAQAETIRLTPEQAEEAQARGAAKRQHAAELGLPDGAEPDRGVHGEVGVAIGTGGYRSYYGEAAIPLGNNGGVVLGYNQERGRSYGYGDGLYGRYPCPRGGYLLCRSQYDLDGAAGN